MHLKQILSISTALISILSLTILVSCDELFGVCGDDKKVATEALKEESFSFLPNTVENELVFENDESEEVIFRLIENSNPEERAAQFWICDDDRGIQHEYVAYLSRFIKYSSQIGDLRYQLLIANLAGDPWADRDSVLVDIFAISKEFQFPQTYDMVIICSERGNGSRIESLERNGNYQEIYRENHSFHADTTIRERGFANVYRSENDEGDEYVYSLDLGLVAFRRDDKLWVVK